MKKTSLTTLIGFVLATSALADIQDPPANDYGPTRKLGRGFSNLLFASAELSQSVCEMNIASGNSAAASYGIIRGLGRSTTRHFAGLFEVFTFPFPVPHDSYRPALSNGIARIHAGYSEFPAELGFQSKYTYCRDY